MKNINSSVSLKQSTKSENELVADLERANEEIGGGEMVDLFIPEAYRGSFGDPLKFSVAAVTISVPIGKRVKVPLVHFEHAQTLMKGAVINKSQKHLSPEELYKD